MNRLTLGTFRATNRMRVLIDQVLDTGRLSYGPLSGEFETRFAIQHGCLWGILANSGTSALQAALQALKERFGWADGDEVLVPAITFVATVNVCYHCRLTPVLVDVDPNDYAIDPSLIEQSITNRTRCIIPVHPFGQPAQMGKIKEIALSYNLKILEDSCEAMFVSTDGVSVGAWGDAAAFSTYTAHLLVTGVGGMITTNDESLGLHIRSLVNHGIDISELPDSSFYDPGHLARVFCFTSIGHSFRLTELEAAIGLPQLEDWAYIIDQRQANARFFMENLSDLSDHLQLPYIRPDCDHAFMVFPIVLRSTPKTKLVQYLTEQGIEVRSMLPLTTQPCYSFNPKAYPVADWINRSGFYIGCHQNLDPLSKLYAMEKFHAFFTG